MAQRQLRAVPGADVPLIPAPLGDLRFRKLLGAEAWATLPNAVRARFGKRVCGGDAVTYVGTVTECRMTRAGAMLARLALVIGGPLPLGRDTGGPAIVSVTEDAAGDGQFWTRSYARARGFPQVIHSSKRFAGPTGLEEYLGAGVGIALRVEARPDRLLFLADHYFVAVGGWRWRFPRWLAPGALTIAHVDRGDGSFAFELTLRHPLLGELIHQVALFCEHRSIQEVLP